MGKAWGDKEDNHNKIDNTCSSNLRGLIVVSIPRDENRHCEQRSPTAVSKTKKSPKRRQPRNEMVAQHKSTIQISLSGVRVQTVISINKQRFSATQP